MTKADQLAHDVIAHQVIVVDIYCRVSTDPQDNNSSFPEQEASCREHIEELRRETGLNIVVGMVHEETYTGYLYRERKKLALMRERYRTGKIQGVAFRTLDRLSRKQEHVAILIEEMEHHEIQIYCAKEKRDDTPVGKIVRMVLAFMAEMEREKIMDRMFTGRIRKAEKGEIQVITNGKAPYWCKWIFDENGEKEELVLDEEKAKVIEFMAESFDNGVSISQIGKQLEQKGTKTPEGKDEWLQSAVRRYLKDPRIAGLGGNCFSRHEGKKPMQEVSYPDGTYPAVISVELFERIQRRLEANRQDSARNSKHHQWYLLRAGFVFCECGRAMIGTTDRKGGRPVYQCGDPKCGRRVNSKKLDEIIWDRLKELADQTELVAKAIELATSSNVVLSEVTSIERSLASWQKKVNNYMDDLEDPDLAGETRAAIRKA